MVTLSVLFGGCASVMREEGVEELAASEIAVLEIGAETIEGAKLKVTHVDGKYGGIGSISKCELKAGEHTVKVTLDARSPIQTTLQFVAEKGATYILAHKIDSGYRSWSISIANKTDGKVVSQRDVKFRRMGRMGPWFIAETMIYVLTGRLQGLS
jgi:hypothetical protein